MRYRTLKEIQNDIGQVTLHIEEEKQRLLALEWEWEATYDKAFEAQSELQSEHETYFADRAKGEA